MKRLTLKLGNMRKETEWIVYPVFRENPNKVMIQSDKRICAFDATTGKGMLSKACPSGAYFLHLSQAAGAEEVTVTQETIQAILAARPQKGDQIAPGVYVA